MENQQLTTRAQIRQQIRALRRSLSAQQQTLAGLQLITQTLQIPVIQQANKIGLFLSADGEINTQPLIEALWEQGKQTYLPRIHPFSKGNLIFQHYCATTPLITHRFGVQEPAPNVGDILPFQQLDIVIVPLVAFDSLGQRLGMGGGFYDRTLANWQQDQTLPIGIAHDCQHLAQLPCEAWDIPLPMIITPSKVWQWPISTQQKTLS